MVFGWLFGDKKKQEATSPDLTALINEADQATNARDTKKGEELCREIIKRTPDNADAWNMLGVNLIRRNFSDPESRAQAVIAWMRALAIRPGDNRAADHLRAELQFPEELVGGLVSHLGDPAPAGDDAAGALAQIGSKARGALGSAAAAEGTKGERARAVLANLP